MSSKVALEKRRPDTVISECRVRRRDASEKRGLAGLRQSPWGECASGSADKLVRRDRHGFPAARTFDAIVLPAERHAPIIGCDQPAVRDCNGLHLAWGPTSCDLYCSAGGRNWPDSEAPTPGPAGPLTEVDLPCRRSEWHGSF